MSLLKFVSSQNITHSDQFNVIKYGGHILYHVSYRYSIIYIDISHRISYHISCRYRIKYIYRINHISYAILYHVFMLWWPKKVQGCETGIALQPFRYHHKQNLDICMFSNATTELSI